ncbi:glucose 1-dehydrogenase [Paenibacillus eucommiae]|uniref:NAD(P)-dependent dehydrogenase (Short-subunit alcohol dehydrogenase family) n=1 Tax=Paenibacillus eucommiae TaxID=1355755 RepID=A0ABS4IU67_9BACL|nr:glucose 1-dehydrogenase [Paenibacillus eucommiae]MBP1991115.1 NAD(P)-dependent dehydrogenase (short-subunit alcohol dehydrogenase family) [Paenibacillus eucommiae]
MLQNKVAIVTGAGSGMGRAIAVLFAAKGAKVIVTDINQGNIDKVVTEIKEAGGTAIGLTLDVSKESEVQEIINKAVETYGTLDIAVNNAGIMDNFVPAAELTNEHWDRVIGINLNGPMYVSRASLQVMLKQGKGVIVNIASVGGLFGARGGAAYVASKHGLIGLTKNIAATYGLKGIRANVVAPGAVKTNIGSTITEPNAIGLEAIQRAGQGPAGEAEEIANVALFLASDASSFVNGAVVTADGGWTAH